MDEPAPEPSTSDPTADMVNPLQLLDLPDSALHTIFDHLSARTLKRLRRVCKRARALVNERVRSLTLVHHKDLQQLSKYKQALFPLLQRFQLHRVETVVDTSPGSYIPPENYHELLGDLVLQCWEDRLTSLSTVSFKNVQLDDALLYLTVHMDVHLTSLSLDKCDLGRHGTQALRKLTNLTSLTLLSSSGVDYTVLHKLTNLKYLTCHSSCACTDVPAIIRHLSKLESLELGEMPLDHMDLSSVTGLSSLRSLSFVRCTLERALLTMVAPQRITSLNLSGSLLNADTLPHIAQACAKLQEFTVTFDKIMEFDVQHINRLLRHCSGLTRLVFEDLAQDLDIRDSWLDTVQLPNLRALTTYGMELTEGCICPWSRLCELRVTGPPTEDTWPSISSLTKITCESIKTDYQWMQVMKQVNLKVLSVTNDTFVGDNVLHTLQLLPTLRELHLTVNSSQLSNSGIATISKACTSLEVLSLRCAKHVTDAGIVTLVRWPSRMREVYLCNMPGVGDAAVVALASMPTMERIYIKNCEKITPECEHLIQTAGLQPAEVLCPDFQDGSTWENVLAGYCSSTL